MTRETKIGLLVGLAFIIVIGILLSDHLTSTNEPQQAQLAQVAGNVRTSVAAPGAAAQAQQAPVTISNAPSTPQQQVPTKEELTPAKPPVEIVQIGGASQQHAGGAIVAVKSPTEQSKGESSKATQGVAAIDSNSPPVARQTEPVNGTLRDIAHGMGEDIVSLDRTGSQSADSNKTPPSDPAAHTTNPIALAALPAGARQCKAEAGDSLSKLASKFLGSNSKANRDAIIAANPTLQQNANMVIAGRSYIIPASTGVAATSTKTPAQDPAQAPIAIADKPAEKPADKVSDRPAGASPDPQYFYTVKSGDSLTKIAVNQLGSASAVNAIIDLNKDTLGGKDIIRPNMKLKLPAKPLASAQ